MWDSTQASGFKQITLAEVYRLKHAWYTMSTLVLDFANGFCQQRQLVNGENAFTGMTNAIPGVAYKIELTQPASGAAGTITLTPTGPNTVRVMGSLNLSPTNNKKNYLILIYNDAGSGVFTAAISQEF